MDKIPRSTWPQIREMYIDQGKSRQQIADHLGVSIRAVMSALYHMDCKLSPEQLRARMRDRLAISNKNRRRKGCSIIRTRAPYTMGGLLTAATHLTKVTANDVKSHRRQQYLVRIRWAVWFLSQGHFSYPQIGRTFSRDHSTIIHGCQQALKLIETDEHFRDLVASIRNEALRAQANQRQAVQALIEGIAA